MKTRFSYLAIGILVMVLFLMNPSGTLAAVQFMDDDPNYPATYYHANYREYVDLSSLPGMMSMMIMTSIPRAILLLRSYRRGNRRIIFHAGSDKSRMAASRLSFITLIRGNGSRSLYMTVTRFSYIRSTRVILAT